MSQFWQELIKQLGGLAIIAGALAWLIREIVKHYLSKDVEKFKSQLAHESATEMEEFKAQLQITAKEHDIRFSKLHEKRAEILSEFYLLLHEANMAIGQFDLNLQHQDSHNIEDSLIESSAENARQLALDVFAFYRKHQLYLSKELSDSIKEFIHTIEAPASAYSIYRRMGASDEFRADAIERWNRESPKVSVIMQCVEKEFRMMLGSDNERPNGFQESAEPTKVLSKG